MATLLIGSSALSSLVAGAFPVPIARMAGVADLAAGAPARVEATALDFSGSWTYEPPAPEVSAGDPPATRPARPPTGLCAARCTIVEDGATITVTRLRPGDAPTILRVDGVERQRLQRNPVSRQEFEGATRTVREGATLAIYSTTAAPQPGQVRTTLALVEGRLVIESAIDLNGRRTVHRFTYRRAAN